MSDAAHPEDQHPSPRGDGRRVVVIGGGAVGAACAYYLANSGCNVQLLERATFGCGSSHGNCGYVSPSHVLPLTAPGALSVLAKAMMTKDAALVIKPRVDPLLWTWLLKFASHCRRGHMIHAATARHTLLQASRALYDELLATEEFDCEWQSKGLLFVYNSERDFEEYAAKDELLRSQFGVGATRYNGAELVDLEPALKTGLAGAWHYECDAHLRPDKLMASWRTTLARQEVEIVEDCSVERFVREQGEVAAVETTQGRVDAEAFVLATGALAPMLGRQLGITLPIQPGKGYSITMPRPSVAPTLPMILEEYHVGVTPMLSGYRLGSTMEFAGYDATINPRRLALLRKGARQCLREPYCEPVEEEWCGWRPMSCDELPCIGPAPGAPNLFVAAGHGMLGISMSPATGKMIAEMVVGEPTELDPTPYAVTRFNR